MAFHLWLAFVAASTALLLIPGPTVILVLSYAISQGRSVAMATVAGVALGDLVAMTASLAGLGAIVLASATLFTALKWIGAAYLVYMGIRLFQSASAASIGKIENVAATTPKRVFLNAATVTALNPKSIVFFIAFVSQFVTPDLPLLPQFTILIATFVGLATINALAYAILADRMRHRMSKPSVIAALSRIGGGALIAMGVAAVAFKRTPA